MASVFDVAAYILRRQGAMTAMKLQKLVYYAQAWSLVWDDKPLFRHCVQAWAMGPVAPALYRAHKGKFRLRPADIKGKSSCLSAEQTESIDAVRDYYGDRSSQWLSDLTRAESPWRDARHGLAPGERGHAVISRAAMVEYYAGLVKGRT